jgi:RNA polymerase sigma-70 factor (ECF subfamily)
MRGPDARARARAFPDTSWVVIRDARDARSPTRQASIARLVELYRAPVDAYLRRRWQLGASDAEDLTQEFFRSLLARDLLARVAPDRGRFRAFVKTVVDNLHRMAVRRALRAKRGGRARHVRLVEQRHGAVDRDTPERLLLRRWALGLVDDALAEMRASYTARGRLAFDIFWRHDVERPPGADLSHKALAAAFGVGEVRVNNALHRCRAHLRRLLLERARDAGDDGAHVLAELRALFARS